MAPSEFRTGERLFRANCSGCHPYGTNIVTPDAELRGSDAYKSQQTFIRWIGDPKMDNGTRGVMPPSPPSRISDMQAGDLRAYIVKVMGPAKEVSPCDVTIPTVALKTNPANIARGKELFEINCKHCHRVTGRETVVGPSLKGLLKHTTFPVGDWPSTPENVFKQLRCPYREMPSFEERLKDDEVIDIIVFLNAQ